MPATAFDGSIWVAGGQIAGLGEMLVVLIVFTSRLYQLHLFRG
jgi:hypothetical protein